MPCREEVQRAQLEAVADLPDAVQHHAVALIVGRKPHSPPRSGAVANVTCSRPLNGLRVGVVEPRQRVGRRALPALAEPLGQRRLQARGTTSGPGACSSRRRPSPGTGRVARFANGKFTPVAGLNVRLMLSTTSFSCVPLL